MYVIELLASICVKYVLVACHLWDNLKIVIPVLLCVLWSSWEALVDKASSLRHPGNWLQIHEWAQLRLEESPVEPGSNCQHSESWAKVVYYVVLNDSCKQEFETVSYLWLSKSNWLCYRNNHILKFILSLFLWFNI